MATYKVIAGDQKEYGPATADILRRWLAEGRLTGQSLVQAEGSNEWKPLASLPEFADALRAQVGLWPAAGALAPPLAAATWSAQILARQPELQIGRCLARAWDLFVANFGLLFGATFLAWALGWLCQFIPFVGNLVYWLARGVLYGGLYLVFLNRIRGRPASVADVFAGFSVAFAQLLLVGFLTTLLSGIAFWCCLMLPGLYLLVAWVFSVPLVADRRLEFWSAMELSRKVVTRVWFEVLALLVLAFLPAILMYLFVQVRILYTAFPAVQDLLASGQPDFRRLMDLAWQIARVGVPLALLSKVVLLLNLPFAVGALMYAYEDLFGSRPAPTP